MQRRLSRQQVAIGVCFGVLLLCLGSAYIFFSVRNVPVMDTWRDIVELAPATMNNQLKFSDICKDYIGHRNPFSRFCIVINILLFNLNCTVEPYLGMLVLIVTAFILASLFLKIVIRVNGSGISNKQIIICIPLILAFTTLNQWEILTLVFSFSFQVKILAFIAILYLLDREIVSGYNKTVNFFKIGILSAFVIYFLSQLYFAAMLIIIFLVFAFDILVKRREYKRKLHAALLFFVPCFIGCFVYFYGLSSVAGATSISTILESFLNGNLLKSVLYMLAASILHQNTLQNMTNVAVSGVGILLCAIVVFAVVLYIKLEIYNITYFPAMLAGYGLLSIPIISYGRLQMFDLQYLFSSRYVCETRLIWVGCLFVFALSIFYKKRAVVISSTLLTFLLTIMILFTNSVEVSIAPYRGVYKDNLISIMKQEGIEYEKDDSIFTPFQSTADTVREGIKIMKQYQLGIYHDLAEQDIGNTLQTSVGKSGVYEDGWIAPNASLTLQSGNQGIIHISGWYGSQALVGDEVISIYCNGSLANDYSLTSENIEIDILCEPNTVINLEIKTNFSFQPEPPDIRELAFVLNDIVAE